MFSRPRRLSCQISALPMNPAPPLTRILPFERSVMLGFLRSPDDEHRRLDSVAHRVDSGTENQVLEAAVAVRSHDDEIRLQILDRTGNFLRRAPPVADHHLYLYVLGTERANDVSEIVL